MPLTGPFPSLQTRRHARASRITAGKVSA
jgi:hypothetical protein